MSPDNPEAQDANEDTSTLDQAKALAATANELRAGTLKISDEFLKSMADSENPNTQVIFTDFTALEAGQTSEALNEHAILKDIDLLLAMFPNDHDLDYTENAIDLDSDKFVVTNEKPDKPEWTELEAAQSGLYNKETRFPVEGAVWMDPSQDATNWKLIEVTGDFPEGDEWTVEEALATGVLEYYDNTGDSTQPSGWGVPDDYQWLDGDIDSQNWTILKVTGEKPDKPAWTRKEALASGLYDQNGDGALEEGYVWANDSDENYKIIEDPEKGFERGVAEVDEKIDELLALENTDGSHDEAFTELAALKVRITELPDNDYLAAHYINMRVEEIRDSLNEVIDAAEAERQLQDSILNLNNRIDSLLVTANQIVLEAPEGDVLTTGPQAITKLTDLKTRVNNLPEGETVQSITIEVEAVRVMLSTIMPPLDSKDVWTYEDAVVSGLYVAGKPVEGYTWAEEADPDTDETNWKIVAIEGADETTSDAGTGAGLDAAPAQVSSRAEFLANMKDRITEVNETFSITLENAGEVKWSTFNDFAPLFLGSKKPEEVTVKVGDTPYHLEGDKWMNADTTDYLKVYDAPLTFTVEANVASAEETVAEPVVAVETPPAEPVQPVEVVAAPEETDRIAQSREFTDHLLALDQDMGKLTQQYSKMQRLDKNDVNLNNKDRYQREGAELVALSSTMTAQLISLRSEFTHLKEIHVYDGYALQTLREDRIAGMESKNEEIITWIDTDLKQDAPSEDTPSETVESESTTTDVKELRGGKRQAIFNDIASLPSNQVVTISSRPQTIALPDGLSEAILVIKSGHSYRQKVEGGYVTQRYVQLNGEGEWRAIPYSNKIEEAKASAYQAIENDDSDVNAADHDRKQYRPKRSTSDWQNRHMIGALKLTKVDLT